MADQVRVMRRRDVVLGERASHVVVDAAVLVCEGGVVGGEEEGGEALEGEDGGGRGARRAWRGCRLGRGLVLECELDRELGDLIGVLRAGVVREDALQIRLRRGRLPDPQHKHTKTARQTQKGDSMDGCGGPPSGARA